MNKVWRKTAVYGLCTAIVMVFLPSGPIMAGDSKAERHSSQDVATVSNARATVSNAFRAANSLGNIWDTWSGKTSFEFLDGNHGDGSEGRPFLIKNREQLMGFSELTAMGMTISAAEGTDYAGEYSGCFFALGGNIDMQGIEWIPIGFYRDSLEATGEVTNAFCGGFDGKGYIIKNLKLNKQGAYNHVGLFGAIRNSTIQNVTVIPDAEIKGNDRIGVVAGYAVDSRIQNVTVKNAALRTTGITGGIVGEISGSVIENAVCDNVTIDAKGGSEIIYIGGIAGIASDSTIMDCEVSAGNGVTARIQGTGYTGGITGYQNVSNIYNTHVSGTIGGYRSTAIGGITGRYGSGNLKVARFEGVIGNSQLGSLAREGTFIGTRQGAATNFNYIEDVAYLFADAESKISANVCGSEISDDNDYTYAAHIGCWHKDDLYYTLIQGGSIHNMTNQYFYEELENGILKVLDKEENDTIDHFAPNSVGRPARGYLIIVNQADIVANGQNFYDIAALEVKGASQYSKVLDKDHRGAAAAGAVVYVSTTPNNTDTEKFQMDGAPYYRNREGKRTDTAYSDVSHSYTFRMPKENLAVAAKYKKVAVAVSVDPETYNFSVVQTRTGNRKCPVKTTEIKNKEGKLIAKYINGTLEQGTQVQPVRISAVIDTNNDVDDNRVKWSIDDADLIHLSTNDEEGTDGYTSKSASVTVNLDAGFFTEILTQLEQKQIAENYRYKIPNTIYGSGHQNGGVAILTAATRPSASFEGKNCTANSRINVTYQIIDNTLVAAEDAALSKKTLEFTVTRTLSGNRTEPVETIQVTEPQPVTAVFTPDFFSRKEVIWKAGDSSVITVSQDDTAYKEALILACLDAKWIRDVILVDEGIHTNDRYARLSGHDSRTTSVMVEGKDRLGNHATVECPVTVRFVTEDKTVIKPEGIGLYQTEMECLLGYDKAGDINSKTTGIYGFENRKLIAMVQPDIEEEKSHQPYDRSVNWTSSDPSAVNVDESGTVNVVDGALWIEEALLGAPYQAEKRVSITARTNDGKLAAICKITLKFQVNCIVASQDTANFDIVLTKTGKQTAPALEYIGAEKRKLNAVIYSDNQDLNHVVWTSSDPSILQVTEDGMIEPILFNDQKELKAEWIAEAIRTYPHHDTKNVTVTAAATDGRMRDKVLVTLTFRVVDHTYSSGGSGNSGNSSGGGGGGSTGITPEGKTTGSFAPAGSVTGTWTQAANGKWIFASDRTYAGEWAYINNPYAAGDQERASWFRFDPEGFLMTGWYTDFIGDTYYLSPMPNGTQGQMLLKWQLIDGTWYYFSPVSDGTRGKLITDSTVDGIYRVNEKGQWIR